MHIDNFFKKNNYLDVSVDENDRFLPDLWLEDYPRYIMHYKTSPKSDILTINESNTKTYHIIWDVSFWELFTKFIYINDEQNFSPVLDTNILMENNAYIVAMFFKYLSRRYSYYPELSERLNREAQAFGYQTLVDNLYENTDEKENYDFAITLCKQFAFWHEVAHAEFDKYDAETALYEKHVKLIYTLLDEFQEDEIVKDIPSFNKIKQQIKDRTVSPHLIEELAADLRAIQRMIGFEAIFNVKKNLSRLIESVILLIDFTTTKSLLDQRWDYFVKRKDGTPPTLIESQIIRRILFPVVVYMRIGRKALGDSFIYDIVKKRTNADLFSRVLDVTEDECFIKSLLNMQYDETDAYQYNKNHILNVVYRHMGSITADISSKKLKYLFNVAHAAQHGDAPLDSIPLYYKFIDIACEKNNENKRNIGDAYSRIARVYAETGQSIKAKILINNAIDIAENLSHEDIGEACLFNNIGNVYLTLGELDNALEYYLKSLRMRLRMGDLNSIELATVYNNLGFCLHYQKRFAQALRYYLDAYKILKLRYDENHDALIELKKHLRLFGNLTTNISKVNVSIKTPLTKLKTEYEKEKNNTDSLRNYLLGMVRDLLVVPFDDGCNLYIDIIELVQSSDLVSQSEFFSYALVNIRDALKVEFEEND